MPRHHHHPTTVSLKLKVSALATVLFVVVELVAGILANALALVGDALHNLTDSVALLLALFVVWLEVLPRSQSKTFGYQRAGILAAFVNAGFLVAFTIYLLVEAWHRFRQPEAIDSFTMIWVAAIGILLNVAITLWLRKESADDINIRAATVHLFGDTLSSAGVIVAALLIRFTGNSIFDPIVTGLIAILIFWSAWGILKETINLLLEGTPDGIDPDEITTRLASQPGVLDVHHVHIWAIAPTRPALSCHLKLGDVSLASTASILERATTLLQAEYGITHTTIQFEHDTGCPDDDPHCITSEVQVITS
ncbi:MAG: cation diffusion facilitator family transporter [Acidobacteria bacterium]|nr:cation diffusion facilitator family transporter [Acidobacteriota bacterium]